MRETKIVVQKHGDILVTVARSAPIEAKIIAKRINYSIEPISMLKQKASDVLGTTPTVPNLAPQVGFF